MCSGFSSQYQASQTHLFSECPCKTSNTKKNKLCVRDEKPQSGCPSAWWMLSVPTHSLYLPGKAELSEYIVFKPLWFGEVECSEVRDVLTAVSRRCSLSLMCLSSLLLYSFSLFVANVEVHLIF